MTIEISTRPMIAAHFAPGLLSLGGLFHSMTRAYQKRGQHQTCTVAGCTKKHIAKGLCIGHYQRLKKTGSTSPEIPLSKSHFGASNSKWNGGQTTDGNGRTYLYRPNHPHANQWGYVYRYRIVMEEKLGRILEPHEIVHHKDEDESNDAPDNLEITTRSLHIKIHLPKMKGPKWLAAVRAEHQKRKAKAY